MKLSYPVLLAAALSALCTLPTYAGGQPNPAEPAQASPGKPGAPVRLSHRLDGTPTTGVPLTLVLHFASDVRGEVLRLQYGAEPGLLLNSQPSQRFELDGSTVPEARLSLTPERDGLYYVRVLAELGGRTRAFAVPIAVGKVDMKARLKPQGQLLTTPEGRTLISLPAEETVRPQ